MGWVAFLIISSGSSAGSPEFTGIEDTCLTFALFKLQLRRLVGCPIAEADSRRAFGFVQDGLLNGSHERAFRVIETELSFLADFLYSKLTVFYAGGWWFPALNSMFVLSPRWDEHRVERREPPAAPVEHGELGVEEVGEEGQLGLDHSERPLVATAEEAILHERGRMA
ncbi:hypothetical protein GUJ93_ZPchr0002g25697 [Zizania palustris]|uniref:DUF4220 domain-containing protein n=1 Tax=Zizania palustris TaxID=103762 RepID=A0A8J5SRE0_ZIZPA|nr:hypothetical protein GUJ93_ZPchr0002g25697 [Zizania palustris]